jgi:multisubunit Na+/H+ antiporter MnhG subunit
VRLPSLETRARIATGACRAIGWLLLVCGVSFIFLGITGSHDCVGPIVSGVITALFGVAFLVAKPITAEHLKHGWVD